METRGCNVCVTGGSGYIGSLLVKKLLQKGYTVHATLRDLGNLSKVELLKSFPNAESNLVLFEADIYNPDEFDKAIHGCQYVFHVATPMLHNTSNTQLNNTTEAAVVGVQTIIDGCIRSKTVKRLIYTASVMASSYLAEEGLISKSCVDESCWTPINRSYPHANEFVMDYIKSKTLAEKEVLSYKSADELEVVTLACGLVGGDALFPHLPGSVATILAPLRGDVPSFEHLKLLQHLLGSLPLVHVDDVCEAHIFCIEKELIQGRFLCVVTTKSLRSLLTYCQENYPQYSTSNLFIEDVQEKEAENVGLDNSKLMKMGFKYNYDIKNIIYDSVEFGKGLGAL